MLAGTEASVCTFYYLQGQVGNSCPVVDPESIQAVVVSSGFAVEDNGDLGFGCVCTVNAHES